MTQKCSDVETLKGLAQVLRVSVLLTLDRWTLDTEQLNIQHSSYILHAAIAGI